MKHRSATLCAALVVSAVAALSGCSSEGDPVSFAPKQSAKPEESKASDVLMPTHPREWTTQRELPDGTRVVRTDLAGPKSGFTGRVWAWVPKQYGKPEYKDSAFPVLMALPGAVGYPTNYFFSKEFRLQERIGEAADKGESLPFIVVMPVLNANKDTYYDGSDIPGQPKMGTWISDDVPDLVRENFRTYADPKGWGFFGSSSGGYVGMKMVLQYPERFSVAIAGGPDAAPDSPLWNGHPKEKQENSPAWLAEELIKKSSPTPSSSPTSGLKGTPKSSPARSPASSPASTPASGATGSPKSGSKVAISFLMGTKEPKQEVAALEKLRKEITKGPIETRVTSFEGGHDGYKYTDTLFNGDLKWMSDRMRGPVAAK
ncbi:esterase family protein [Streptomyces sp. 2132.2]|uniref:alpha/beta hydrolase n=1 Tax=Streptomyces sp. 2132.2 TaxID=2485161 RepID=UPI0021A53400|nr:esterase family protein [Streptomyces sp. 2132.2]